MVLSIRPRHVSDILEGTKTVELRRTRPRIELGQPVAIYGTSPVSAVVATCRITRVESGPPGGLKARVMPRAALSSAEFDEYFDGARCAVAIHLADVAPLERAVTLADLRLRRTGYHPPQSWHFFDRSQLCDLIGGHVSHSRLLTLLT